MSVSTPTQQDSPVSGWFAKRWCDWKRRRKAIAEISAFQSADRERLAHDVGVSESEFCILAGKWPDASTLLSQRLEQLKLNAADIAEAEPQVLRDLQRVCTLCVSKRKCRHDLAMSPSSPAWEEYCPNALTLRALLAERCQ